MADFCAIADIEQFLQVDIDGDEAKVLSAQRAMREASAAIRDYCEQEIGLIEDEAITLDVWELRRTIPLPQMPVVSVASVIEDGDTLTVGTDEDYVLIQYGRLYRVGQNWERGPQIVVITYPHGYDEIPDDIAAVCARAASRAYQAGLRATEDAGVLGVVSKSLGDFAVGFGSAAGGGIGEGLMGASGSRMLLLSEKDILAQYRMVLP